MDAAAVVIVIVLAIVVIWVVYLLRDRILELGLSLSGQEAKMNVKAKTPESPPDDKPVSVVFKGNKLRGEGEYRMRNSEFSENDVDGKQKVELGYDEAATDANDEENQ
ncbi:hypothetical protein [Leptolyngbya iicbica]|uniref:Uncharacterized protein n=2 Tax=Cyanophyceae TaxID=3028117 RepID=A0A4Q7E4R4_9CYAN|nr:hypothetical protein [Leptolyngbya sp. LK]RZM76599.1 hypothetical protein DYY88_18220 [Leptolyngbya sp. LK]